MAKIYSIPEELEATMPTWSIKDDHREHMRREEKWLEELRQWCMVHGSGKYAGQIVRDGVADGYAQYVVFSLRPLQLIHIPLGDAWQSRWAHRWTAADIKQMVERAKLFSKKS